MKTCAHTQNAVGRRYPAFSRTVLIAVVYIFLLELIAVPAAGSTSAAGQDVAEDLTELSLEELMNVEVTLVSRKKEKQFESGAAVFVVTNEDIRRSGATTIPDALRMVPGLHVARVDGNTWAVTARGFNSEYADMLLVLIDGRQVYTPRWSGVYWDMQDLMLEDVDRIEVIRGPGGTMWGANAVNGVINIVTKSAEDTQGGLLSLGAGDEERAIGGIRYGDRIGEAYFRVYGKYINQDETGTDWVDADDDDYRKMIQGGFRLDWDPSDEDSITFQGDILNGKSGTLIWTPQLPPSWSVTSTHWDNGGGNLLARWSHTFSESADISLQAYYDRVETGLFLFSEKRDTADFDFQHRFSLGDRHEIVWGLGYRYTAMNMHNSPDFKNDPRHRGDDLVSAFIQDEITLVEDELRFIAGSKFEYNDYTGLETQPNARIVWTPNDRNTLWGSVARAVQTPGSFFTDSWWNWSVLTRREGGPAFVWLAGNDDVDSQNLLAYEVGYRVRPVDSFSVDVAAFWNEYDNLMTWEYAGYNMSPAAYIWTPDNKMDGETYGLEIAANWDVTDRWRLAAGYTLFHMDLELDGSSTDIGSDEYEEIDPKNQFNIRSHLDLPKNLEFDTSLYYVDNLPYHDVPSYFRLDARLAWNVTEDLELSVVGQNLLDDEHWEFGEADCAKIERSVYGKLTWQF